MKEFKGTPGPWFEHREGSSTVYVEGKLRDGVIQEVAACGPTEAGSEAQSANARLIAAAPELLSVAVRVMNQLHSAGYHSKHKSLNPTECMLYQLESAISKALGESNE